MTKQEGITKTRSVRKKRRLKYIAVLPSLVTLMNGLCGFTAILFASRGVDTVWRPFLLPKVNISFLALAGYMIFLGMIADVLDGHVARISKSTSSFGAQLDSLCDAISFGAAPAFLMLKLVEVQSHELYFENVRYMRVFGRLVYLAAIVYAMCAIIRLARFNVENKPDESSHLSFAGLPSPPAAGMIVSLVIFHQDFLPKIMEWPNKNSFHIFQTVTVWALPVITLIAGLLMVTRIPYPHVVNRVLRGKKSFPTFILVVFTLLLVIWNIQIAMVLGFLVFTLYGLIRWLVIKVPYRKGRVRTSRENSPM